MRVVRRNIVSALILSGDGMLWLGKKDPNGGGVFANCWHIPGGGVDDRESEVEALIRELMEETTLVITKDQVVEFDREGGSKAQKTLDDGEVVLADMKFNVYKVKLTKTAQEIEIVPSDDLVDGKWVSVQDILDNDLTPATLSLIERKGLYSLFE